MRVEPKGIEDLAERVFIKMGVTAVVKRLVGESDCGCEKRKEKLNKLVPFKDKKK